MPQITSSPKSICIIRLSSIGDITHMIPIIQTLKYYLPKTNLTWVIGKTEYSLVKNIKNIDFVVIDKNNFLQAIRALMKIKDKKYDILLHMQVSFRSNIISTFINAKRKIGFDSTNSKNLHSLFINEKISPTYGMHVMDTFFCFLSKIGLDDKNFTHNINIKLDSIINLKEKYIVINPFTSSRRFNYREWDINNYNIIIDYLHKTYKVSSIIIGGNSKYELENSILFNKKSYMINMVGKTNLEDAYNLIKLSELYIGPDSGTLHIASMLKKPVIGLYATSNPLRTGPYYDMEYTINKYPEALKIFNNKTKHTSKWGERVRHKKAMSLIKTEEVINNIDKILNF